MNEYQLPEQILFNYEELKAELTEKVSMYETMVYTDDQIKEAKKDKANLNKLKNALNDERIRREKEYMIPFNAFKAQINEIINIIDKPVAVIDKQVKAYEDKQKQDKLDSITQFFNGTEHPEWLHLSQIMDEKWMNASVSLKSVKEAIDARLDQIELNLTTLHDLPSFGFEATEEYKRTLDMNKAIAEGQRLADIQNRKQEAEEQAKRQAEAMKAEEQLPGQMEFHDAKTFEECINPPVKQWIGFKALLSTEDALALKAFFESRNIEFQPIK